MNDGNTGGERHYDSEGERPGNFDGNTPEEAFDHDPLDVRLADDSLFDSAAFERFDLWMDGSLKLLVGRFASMAAPRASRPFFGRIHGGRMPKPEGKS